jgi:hypothetical protein
VKILKNLKSVPYLQCHFIHLSFFPRVPRREKRERERERERGRERERENTFLISNKFSKETYVTYKSVGFLRNTFVINASNI